MTESRALYPDISPYHAGMLDVGDGHSIYYEECGDPHGIPVVFIHGGPGGGTSEKDRRYFDPARYRAILFHQRGCGKSTPFASLENNTTWKLVEDIEKLRGLLGVERWVVFGGSWGSTLSLTYAIQHPERVRALVLRGIFLLRRKEIEWFYQEGASWIFPDFWEEYLKPIPPEERGDLISAYHRRLTSDDPAIRLEAARAWSIWEGATSCLYVNPELISSFGQDDFATAFARIESHYFVNRGFFGEDDWLLRNVGRIRNIPGVIVQGRYDVVCPMTSAWDLHKAWPESKLIVVPNAGHSSKEPGIIHHLVIACDEFAAR
ncbi:MAG: Proline iminopeptidase [Myxococcota bacterium]|nr:Proline iminopeptidase [Myxococcota bacterium]